MSSRGRTLLVAALVVVVLLLGGALLPVPYVALGPGPTFNTLGQVDGQPLIDISGRQTYPATGHLNLTTVSVASPLDLGSALVGWLDSSVAVVPRQLVFPPGRSRKQVEAEDTQQMVESQQHATTAALRQLGIPVPAQVQVASLQAGLPAAAELRVGDTITTIDGTAVTSADQLRMLIGRRAPGDAVSVGYVRDGRAETASIRTTTAPRAPNRALIGLSPREVPQYPFSVKIRLQDVGGPSAGLMFALGIYDELTPGDLTGGAFVAGTGEIDDAGTVGPIGGIRQKVIAARQQGATVFLAPAANCAELAGATPKGLRLVKVTNLAGALDALEQLRTGGSSLPSCGS